MSDTEFETLKRQHLKNGELYEDDDFPAKQASVFYHQTPPFQFIWKRPKEIHPEPIFLQDSLIDHNRFDIVTGKLGDRWLVSCFGSLSLTKGLFYRVVPADQSFDSDSYCGIFRFRIWWHGQWKEVIIDDRLPTVNGKLVFIQSPRGDTFWAPLLEKAYAKLHGSYEALKYGSTIDGLSDLTGGVTERISLREETNQLSSLILRLLSMTSIVTAVVHNEASTNGTSASPTSHHIGNDRLANGIYLSTSYRILCVEKIDNIDQTLILIKLRNSLGSSGDYIGSWGKDSLEMSGLGEAERQRLHCGDGEFWMCYSDFMRTFTALEVVHLDGETSKDEPSLRHKQSWMIKLWRGYWRKGVTAGGCRNYGQTFHNNPQFLMNCETPNTIVVCLNQHATLEPKVIGFSIYPFNNADEDVATNGHSEPILTRLNKNFFKRNRSLHNTVYSNSKQISLRCNLDTGRFVLIPTCYEPGQEGHFSVRIYSMKNVKLQFLDYVPSLLRSPIVKAPSSFGVKFSQYESKFLEVADEHKTVNAFELQELLEACLPNDYVKSCATVEVCRRIIAALDSNGSSGRIKLTDYKNAMCSLRIWQNVFKNHTESTPGILRAHKLREALYDIGFQLNIDILSFLMLRYMRRDATLRFGDFVAIVLHLCLAFNLFEKKDPNNSGFIRLSLTEWVKACLLA